MSHLDAFLTRIASPYVAALAIVALILVSMLFGRLNPKNKIEAALGNIYISTDMSFGYPPEALYRMLDTYTEENGYKAAHQNSIYLDLVYPWVYAVLLVLIVAYVQRFSQELTNIKLHYLWLLPLCAMIFDYAENLSMLWILSLYTKRPPGVSAVSSKIATLVQVSRAMTMLKLLFIYASLFLVLFAIVLLIVELYRFILGSRPQRQT